jgi:hypothetical protein
VVVLYQVRWHGRGGQGAVTAAKIFGMAASLQGAMSLRMGLRPRSDSGSGKIGSPDWFLGAGRI